MDDFIREAPRQKVAIKPDLVTFRAVAEADIAEARTKSRAEGRNCEPTFPGSPSVSLHPASFPLS